MPKSTRTSIKRAQETLPDTCGSARGSWAPMKVSVIPATASSSILAPIKRPQLISLSPQSTTPGRPITERSWWKTMDTSAMATKKRHKRVGMCLENSNMDVLGVPCGSSSVSCSLRGCVSLIWKCFDSHATETDTKSHQKCNGWPRILKNQGW